MVNVLLSGSRVCRHFAAPLGRELRARGVDAVLSPDHGPEAADYIVLDPSGPLRDFTPYRRVRAVLSTWAGAEVFATNATLTQPLARMVDPAMTRGMTEYVVAHAMRHHIGLDAHVRGLGGEWQQVLPPLAPERPVTVLGLGEMGRAAAAALSALGFPVTGWSRTPRPLSWLAQSLSGSAGLHAALAGAQILVILLPLTPGTENLLGQTEFACLAPGARIINAARGPIIDDGALLAALESGQVGHATLDVFRQEPLPPDHPFWHHPRVTVTPHVAAETRPDSAAAVLAENIARVERGEPLLNRVDRAAGY
ncbi:MAG: glyoxylate/hydroxypyruvate reductase A [Rubellimicrobium sp.]|nr:glyoxylate/hydroxypyruvate reductase A [Rubellimicrobium sp.]